MVGAVLAFVDAVVGGGLDERDPISRFSLPINLKCIIEEYEASDSDGADFMFARSCGLSRSAHLFLRKHTSPVRSTEVFRIFVAPESNPEIVLVFGNSCLRLSQTGSKNDGGPVRSEQMPFSCLPNVYTHYMKCENH